MFGVNYVRQRIVVFGNSADIIGCLEASWLTLCEEVVGTSGAKSFPMEALGACT